MIYKLFLASSIMILNIYLYQRYIKRYIIDKPNLRSSHKKPIPTGAGITFAISFTIIAILEGKFIYLICLPLSLIGLIDDIKGLPSILRYLAQLIFAYFLIIKTNINLFILDNNFLGFAVFIFLLILITAIINLEERSLISTFDLNLYLDKFLISSPVESSLQSNKYPA